jgi:ABC-type cobalamin/Fe3+-siderophores transport system ATPase subunit
MNILESVWIEGFWGERTINFDFHDDVNFIIGINGSGKTTVINLIVSMLTADLSALSKIDFTQARIKLKSTSSRKKPSVYVRKFVPENKIFDAIEFEVRESVSEAPIIKINTEVLDDTFYNRRPRHLRYNYDEENNFEIKKIVNVSWLSVHRFNNDRTGRDEDRTESAVDKKLRELSNRLVRYFSTLGQNGAQLLESFQKTVFLSMLHRKGSKTQFNTIRNMDITEEKKALEAIFSSFKVKKYDFQSRLDGHFDALTKAREKLSGKHPDLSLSTADISVLLGTERIDYIVDEWSRLVEERKYIFEPRDTFLKIINRMMQRKEFHINDKNELDVITQSGKYLPITSLSSGEKQLIIVLGEALLQEKKSWVYIADEPELSLHVRWQESLVENLRAINPNAQIIFATHSPDVVSHFGDNVFDMEKLLK